MYYNMQRARMLEAANIIIAKKKVIITSQTSQVTITFTNQKSLQHVFRKVPTPHDVTLQYLIITILGNTRTLSAQYRAFTMGRRSSSGIRIIFRHLIRDRVVVQSTPHFPGVSNELRQHEAKRTRLLVSFLLSGGFGGRRLLTRSCW